MKQIVILNGKSFIFVILLLMIIKCTFWMSEVEKIDMKNKEVFDNYFRRYYQTLCYFVYKNLQLQKESEDIVQEVFIKLLNFPETFENEEHLKHYLYKAVRNSYLNYVRQVKIRTSILEVVQKNKLEDENNFFAGIVRAEIYNEIIQAIKELPVECGRVFRLAYLEGLTNDEISIHLKISVNTVKVHKNKAKILLREKLKGLYPLLFFLLKLY